MQQRRCWQRLDSQNSQDFLTDYFDFGQRQDELTSAFKEASFALLEFVKEMPRHHQEVVGTFGARLFFRNDLDVGSQGMTTPFVGISIGSFRDHAVIDSTELQN